MLSYNLVFVLQGKELPSTLAEAEELNSSTVLDSQSTSLQSSTEDNSPTEQYKKETRYCKQLAVQCTRRYKFNFVDIHIFCNEFTLIGIIFDNTEQKNFSVCHKL